MKGYFDSLCRMVGIDGSEGKSYLCLASWLDHTPFYAKLPGDHNRGNDGVALREGYSDAPGGDPSVFEVLVALSQEMEYTVGGMIRDDGADRWFRVMISNLGLAQLDDIYWEMNPEDSEDLAGEAVYDWLERAYEFDGTGGIFPLDNPGDDQAKVELWYQMNAYLKEILEEKEHSVY